MSGKLNKLERLLPEGLVVDSAWLNEHGYYNSLRAKYVAAGWLEQPARRVYRRPRGTLDWQLVVLSLQTLLDHQLVVGGRTALELQGFGHYLSREVQEVHLYGLTRPPTWLNDLKLGVAFLYHNPARLFGHAAWFGLRGEEPSGPADPFAWGQAGVAEMPIGHWKWPMLVSTPERALLELLDELPDRETFDQVDALVEGLANLSPRRLQLLLDDCRSIKVKRLFFFFADRHGHGWLKRLDRTSINLGSGNRMLAKGGRLDPTYRITVPEDFNAVR
ncbi:type IV toxin-antitoxin system AbiEi family antitoxin domain-containing protein [Brevundimonas sp.]|jgi:hypothetical protein|uniref:type IV toxin-antitoxin system AbiEi family antitoxin domain-containing protein n=1 Tax=Brevundimonas sp. TaxID=1871086 RepID=UPI000A71A0A9|nr:type IV toxin-antitoxin system AbiEi family antitoxin domain-containing protein [Brevundimonas sp.]